MTRPIWTVACLGAVVLGMACGDDAAEPITNAQLAIVESEASDREGTCIALQRRDTGGFAARIIPDVHLDAAGQVTEPAMCVLIPVRLSDGVYWMSGKDIDVLLMTPEFDDDPVRHALETVEDRVAEGSADIRVLALDSDELLWEGAVDVLRIDEDAVEVIVVP